MAAFAPAQAERISGQALLSWRQEQLAAGGQPSALDWLLDLQAGLGWQSLQQLRLHPQRLVELRCSRAELAGLWQRHLRDGQPLQYLVGRCPWRDLELAVEPGVLIPRQETELLVDFALELTASESDTPQLWADLGTGSGCLALALARAWPSSRGLAVDCSSTALQQAAANRARYRLEQRIQLLEGSWWSPLQTWWGQLQLVVSNPPYIPQRIWEGLEPLVRDHEPALALSSGTDGLDSIRSITQGARKALAAGGWLLLEHHHDQSSAVLELLTAGGLEAAQARPDLEGKQRFAIARAPLTP
jgi:release factor glutamine methyltransferase